MVVNFSEMVADISLRPNKSVAIDPGLLWSGQGHLGLNRPRTAGAAPVNSRDALRDPRGVVPASGA